MDEDTIKIINELVQNVGGQSVAYIKLIKNTRGFNWEIKALTTDVDEIEEINNKLMEKFNYGDN